MNSEPKTNLRSASDKQKVINDIGEFLTPVIQEALHSATKTCLTCDHFAEPIENCNKYGGRPPARVIAFGCPGYEDEIPF